MVFLTSPLQIKPYLDGHTYTDGDVPLLTVSSQLPYWEGDHGNRFNRYYRAYERAFRRYCETSLFPLAQASYREALESGGMLMQWRATLQTTVTYEGGGLLSLYTDSVESTASQRIVLRRGDTWDMTSGTPLRLTDFFPPHTPVRKRILSAVRETVEREERLGLYRYLPDWRARMRRSFNPQNFYISDEGLYFFYQSFAIAPLSEGISTFFLPYDEEKGPRRKGKSDSAD